MLTGKRIGILGGTFDPVHLGHIALAKAAIAEAELTRIIIMPAYVQPFKQGKSVTDEEHRLAMTRLAFDSVEKAEARLNKRFGNKPFEEMDEKEKERYQKTKERYEAFDEWFIKDERNTITAYMREVTKHCFVANSNYPYIDEEYVQRRLHQDEAIGFCFSIKQELQYAIETLPVDVNVYLRFAEMIDKEVALIKAWRKSDNRIRDSKE